EAGGEVVVDPVRGHELALVTLLPGLDAGRGIAAKLPADEVDDTALLRKEEAEPVEDVERVRMQRVAAVERVLGDRPRRKGRLELAICVLQLRLGARPQPHQPAANQILDVAHGETESQRVAVANARQFALADTGRFLDALLQGADDQHRMPARPLTQELEEAKILG